MLGHHTLGRAACVLVGLGAVLLVLVLSDAVNADIVVAGGLAAAAAAVAIIGGVVAWRTRAGKAAVAGGVLLAATVGGIALFVYVTLRMLWRAG
jgi:hypothetical protein